MVVCYLYMGATEQVQAFMEQGKLHVSRPQSNRSYFYDLDSGGIEGSRGSGEDGTLPWRVWHHHHHGAYRRGL